MSDHISSCCLFQIVHNFPPSSDHGVWTFCTAGVSTHSTERWSNDVGLSMPDMDMSQQNLRVDKKPSKAANMEGRGNGTIGNLWRIIPGLVSILSNYGYISYIGSPQEFGVKKTPFQVAFLWLINRGLLTTGSNWHGPPSARTSPYDSRHF